MNKLYEMKDMLMAEIDKIAEKGTINMADLETVHKLTDTVKNICKIEGIEERGYSMDYEPYSGDDYDRYSGAGYGGGRSGTSMRRSGNSYGRSGNSYGSQRRDYYPDRPY